MRKRANPDSEANIRRIDSKPRAGKQTHGFQVHFLRGEQSVTKMFSDMVFGGKEGARRAARKFKRTTMAELPTRVFRGSAEKSAVKTPSAARPTAKKSRAAAKKR